MDNEKKDEGADGAKPAQNVSVKELFRRKPASETILGQIASNYLLQKAGIQRKEQKVFRKGRGRDAWLISGQ